MTDSRFRFPNALMGISLVAVLAAACTALFTKPTSDKIRKKVVSIAVHESGENPPRVSLYWQDVLASPLADGRQPTADYPKDWCGAFVLWVLHQAGLARSTKWIIGKGFASALPITTDPKPGDIAYLSHLEHHALVTSIKNNVVTLMNGNGWGGLISPSTMQKSAVTAFYSIEPYIQQIT